MAEPATLLVADDDPGLRESLERTLTREGYRVVLASDGRAALERVQAGGIDLIVTDLRMPGLTGLDLLRAAKAIMPDVDVILLTACGTVEEAVKAMKDGAYDFLTKPFRREQLIKLIDKALERRDLIEQNRALKQQLEDIRAKGQMIGASPSWRRMLTLVEQVADSSATILIQGESGTGKELVARSIHERSARRSGPFVAVNCAALPETLLESELFGYEKGAFTGAGSRKEGRFDLANGGTLFLDEVAAEALERLEAYAWPGNVRELENLVERSVLLARKDRIDAEDLPEEVMGVKRPPRDAILELIGTPLADVEQRLLDETLRITGGNKTQAAKLLGIDVRTVARKLERRGDDLAEGSERL